METRDGRVYLRPRQGGQEWTTYPSEIEPLADEPELVPVLGADRPRRAPEWPGDRAGVTAV